MTFIADLTMYVPSSPEAVREAIPAFYELLKSETHALVRAALDYFFFVYIVSVRPTAYLDERIKLITAV